MSVAAVDSKILQPYILIESESSHDRKKTAI